MVPTRPICLAGGGRGWGLGLRTVAVAVPGRRRQGLGGGPVAYGPAMPAVAAPFFARLTAMSKRELCPTCHSWHVEGQAHQFKPAPAKPAAATVTHKPASVTHRPTARTDPTNAERQRRHRSRQADAYRVKNRARMKAARSVHNPPDSPR